MTHEETVVLTRLVAAACPQQAMDKYTPDAWHDLLGDLSFADCRAAISVLGKRQPFMAPSEIRAEVRKVRDDRLARTPVAAPSGELADEPGKYQRVLQARIRHIADGKDIRLALGGGKPREGEPPAEWQHAREALTEPPAVIPDPRLIAAEQAAESRRLRGVGEAS